MPAETKKKKKGRPSLLDLQKRNLRLQNKNHPQTLTNPNPNPYTRFPSSAPRATRRNHSPSDAASDDDHDEDASNGKRREKKLKLVLRIPNSEDDGDDDEKGERNNFSKGTDVVQGEPSDLGPTTTPLPDTKLLEFILDRLQKKDTYNVFANPVDPEELPDYHELIEHPMDFGTVRKKLSSGAYANLEQFEEDVFLICSNAMQYNSPDTVFYRQARAIQELAKKNFENLRQESDDDKESEPKTVVRRGRPPSKNITKRPIGRPPADRAAFDFSANATLANAGDGTNDLCKKGSASDNTRPYNLRRTEPFNWASVHKSDSNEEYSGFGLRGTSSKYGKRTSVIDENRRNTYEQPQSSTFVEPSIFTVFDREKKQLTPIGLHIEHAYARSLARFAANLGPIGWAIAAKKIERVLPPGTKFGRGWVGDSEAPQPQHSQPPPCSSSSEPNIDLATEADHLSNQAPVSTSISSYSNTQSNNTPVQLRQNLRTPHPNNGYSALGFNFPQVGHMVTRPVGPFCLEAPMTHARALDMVSRNNMNSKSSFLHQPLTSNSDAERPKVSVPPDLNVKFQSPGSPGSSDLALQL